MPTLIECEVCGRQVSSAVGTCPHCANPVEPLPLPPTPTDKTKVALQWAGGLLAVGATALFLLFLFTVWILFRIFLS